MAQVIVDETLLREPNLWVPGKKPVGNVKIDWDHPLAKGVGCFIIRMPHGPFDVARLLHKSSADTSTTRTDWTGLSSAYTGASTSYTDFQTLNITGPHTFATIVDVDTLANYSCIAACQNTTVAAGWEFRLGTGSTDSNILIHRANTNYKQFKASTSNLVSAGSKRNFISVTSVDSSVNTTPTFYVNGTKYTGINVTGTGTGAIGASTHDLYVGKREANTTYLDGSVHMFALWPGRQLSDVEIESLRLDPYQFLIPA